MAENARLVIIGAGIVGCSAAYHLTRLGWRDIVVVDQGPLFATGGSSSHAPGLVFQTNFNRTMTHLSRNTVDLYNRIELDDQPGFYPVGSLEIAVTPERWTDLKRKLGAARAWGLEAELVTPERVAELIPLIDPATIHGAYHVPSDGIAKAVRLCEAMANASAGGARFQGRTAVTGFDFRIGRVGAVHTTAGPIHTEQVLLCAGFWGPLIGRMVGISIPLTPAQHLYALTKPLPELAGETREVIHPVLRHQDRSMYFRHQEDRYGLGSYRHEPLLVDPDEIASPKEAEVMPSIMPFTPEHFEPALTATRELLPAVGRAELDYKINGIFSFTPDGLPLVGESQEIRGFWVAEAVWVTHGGGVGRAVAEWMVDGTPRMDLHEIDLNRFGPHAHSREYVRARGAQQYREVYDIIHPLQPLQYPRDLRLSPFHQQLKQLGAIFFENAGWERPQWFASNSELSTDETWPGRAGWAAQHWSPLQGAEHHAVRQRVGLFDLSPFTKIEVSGDAALWYLEQISSNRIDRPVGTIVYTSMLDRRGGIQCDLTVTRLGADRFLVLTGAGTGPRDLAWMRTHLPSDGSAIINDLTSTYCGIGLWGPKARDVLQRVTSQPVSNDDFPYFTAKQLEIGFVPVWALRLSYVGELGWEIYAETEYAAKLWATLWESGNNDGMIPFGGAAFDSLRLEKGYRLWGVDMDAGHTPLEAGIGWAVSYEKEAFLGRESLMAVRAEGPKRRLSCLVLDDPGVAVLGKEPIWAGNRVVGFVTSANFGYTVGESIAYGYLPVELSGLGTAVEIEYFDERFTASVVREPRFDRRRKRLTC